MLLRTMSKLARMQQGEFAPFRPPCYYISFPKVLMMSHNSFDDAVLARLDEGVSSHQDSAISINSLSANDFKDYDTAKRYDPVSGVASMADFRDDVISLKPFDVSGLVGERPFAGMRPGFGQLPAIEIGFNDRPTKYPLPEVGVLAGETALNALNERIINKAVAKVQESMTPAEKQELNKDSLKYAEQMRKYEEEMKAAMMQHWFRRRPEDWPQPPEKPKSLVKYEEAIDREVERLAKKATA